MTANPSATTDNAGIASGLSPADACRIVTRSLANGLAKPITRRSLLATPAGRPDPPL